MCKVLVIIFVKLKNVTDKNSHVKEDGHRHGNKNSLSDNEPLSKSVKFLKFYTQHVMTKV